mgnify:CR=1 FL=1|tara:strand:- start:222 stop:926 length:705 start_codon:yes stop_codon:yes gene_type:complete
MQDTIKTYKPKRKKIVRRKGGKSIAQGLGSLIGGTGLGYATRDVDIWPEGTSLPVQLGVETGAAYKASKALQNKKVQKYLKDLIKKVGPAVAKRMGQGMIAGGPVPSLIAGGYTLGQVAPAFSRFFPQLTGDPTWKELKYATPEEFQIATIKNIPVVLGQGWDALGESRKETHQKGSAKYKKERAKKKNPLFKTREELLKKYPSIAKKLKGKSKSKPPGVGAAQRGYGKAMRNG